MSLLLPLNLIIFLFSCLIPKNKDLWLFSAWGGLGFFDNPYSIYQKALSDGVNKKIFWISKSKKNAEEIAKSGYPCLYAYSIKGIWAQLRSGVVVFSHQVDGEFVSCFIAESTKRVQTWHGIPIKKIDADAESSIYDAIKYYVKKYIFRQLYNRCDLVIACSDVDRQILARAFRTDVDNVKITGYPRNDQLLHGKKIKNGGVDIIYMPTFRGDLYSESSLVKELILDIDAIEQLLEEINGVLTVKLHPVQFISPGDRSRITASRRIKYLGSSEPVYNWLGSYDVLITDFSGVYFDFMLLDMPIIMAPIRMKEYLQSDRAIYYKYEELCVMSKCDSWGEVLRQLREVTILNGYDHDRHSQLKSKFHLFHDQNSSKRVYECILELWG